MIELWSYKKLKIRKEDIDPSPARSIQQLHVDQRQVMHEIMYQPHSLIHMIGLEIVPKYAVPSIFWATNITIEIWKYFLTILHNHRTKPKIDLYEYFHQSSDHRTIKINGIHNGSHWTYHHLCKSHAPSILPMPFLLFHLCLLTIEVYKSDYYNQYI